MKFLFVGIFVVVVLSVFLIKQSGYNPRPILVMKPSTFDSTKSVGLSLLRRFFKESETSPYIYVICEEATCDSLLLWKGFLEASEKNKLKPRFIYFSKKLDSERSIFEQVNVFDVGTPVKEGSIIFLKNDEKHLVQTANEKNLIFFMSNFYLRKENEPTDLHCDDVAAFKDLSCLALFYSRDFYKKRLDLESSYVGMNRISSNKYVVYIKI